MRVKRAGLPVFLIAACLGQACFLLEECDQVSPLRSTPTPTPPPNNPPVISGFSVAPPEMLAGGSAQVSATITDPDGNLSTWGLTVATGSQATGTFSPTEGSGGAVSSQFSPTSSGRATLRLAAFDRAGGLAEAEVTVLVAPRR